MLASGLTANPRAQGFGGVGREEAIRKDPASLILVINTLKRLHFRMPSSSLAHLRMLLPQESISSLTLETRELGEDHQATFSYWSNHILMLLLTIA